MLLESVLHQLVNENLRSIILVIVQQSNLLLCLVNDMLDLEMIEQDCFAMRSSPFTPAETFNFVASLFEY